MIKVFDISSPSYLQAVLFSSVFCIVVILGQSLNNLLTELILRIVIRSVPGWKASSMEYETPSASESSNASGPLATRLSWCC